MKKLISINRNSKSVIPFILFGSFVFFVIVCFNACVKHQKASLANIDFDKLPLKTISEYGIFDGELNKLQPAENVILYEPIAPLFSDYSFKKRFISMPIGANAAFNINNPNDALDFPEKTILIKNFYYPVDFSKPEEKRQIMETRLLIKYKGKWNAYPYVWNESQNEANYKVTGQIMPVSWTDKKEVLHHINYSVPNKNQCKSCHNQNDNFVPLGLKIKQLNHVIDYGNGKKENQLNYWIKKGYLKNITAINKIKNLVDYTSASSSLNDKARSYLDANCGHCHNRQGPASTSGLYLNYEEQELFHLGFLKSPVAAGIGAGSFKFDINPHKGKESIITYRMNSTHPGIMMPEVGRVSIDKEGVDLIINWIDKMKID